MTKPKTLKQVRTEKERAETQLLQEQHKLHVLLTIPVFLLLGWLIPCMMYDNTAKCSVVEQLRDAQ